jgi:hypothetical protein
MINRGLGLPSLRNFGCARLGLISIRSRARLAEAGFDAGVKRSSLNLHDGAARRACKFPAETGGRTQSEHYTRIRPMRDRRRCARPRARRRSGNHADRRHPGSNGVSVRSRPSNGLSAVGIHCGPADDRAKPRYDQGSSRCPR